MGDKQKKPSIIQEIEKEFQEVFTLFAEARTRMDQAAFLMRKVRLLMSTRSAYEAIMDQDDGDSYIKTERLLTEIDESCMLWRSYMVEIEKEQIKKTTKNPIIDYNLSSKFH